MPHLLPALRQEAQSSSFAIRVLPDSWTIDGSGKCHRRPQFDPETYDELVNDFAEGDEREARAEAPRSCLAIDASGEASIQGMAEAVTGTTAQSAPTRITRHRGIASAALEGDLNRLTMDEIRDMQVATSAWRQHDLSRFGDDSIHQHTPSASSMTTQTTARTTMDRGARRRTQSFMEPEMR